MLPAESYNKYAMQGVLTADPGELTLMLYDGCVRFLKQAKAHASKDETDSFKNALTRFQDIISELMATLDSNYVLADQLMTLYDFFFRETVRMKLENDTTNLDEITGFVTELRDTWQEALKINRKYKHGDGVCG